MYFAEQLVWVDFTIIGLIVIYQIIGLLRGLSKEILSLLSWFLAGGVAWSFARDLSGFLAPAISHPAARIASAFGILLMITLFVSSFIFFLMTERANKARLSIWDHFSGMLVGFIRGLVVVTIIIMLAGLTPLPGDSWWQESKLILPFQASVLWLRDHIPSGLAEFIHFR